MQSSAFLTISDLWIERGERDLCKRLSFDVFSGDVLRILGENGAGKSSLLKVISGAISPLEGKVFYGGQEVTNDRHSLQESILYLGHSAGVKKVLTVEENLRWYCPSVSSSELHSALEALGLLSLLDSSVNTLSAGQIRRVALSRLWLSKQKLWLLDEPFSSLDAEGVGILEKRIMQHTASGGAVILTTHQDLLSLHSRDISLSL
ncbi:transcriptional regulator [Marinomonas ushuaiensis DSM 15871]|uniref:Transcriptional regulator n=1 Tax=Marinomonas ushuaiensis DSM 15871 TaxID=1122207 RepID=X7E4B7_9GAMM|nr:cytochrome c biogenesis heme-transporting ATPase CcmA [Marinomonas ushuaiensis]ETX10874.1 transcriptional regulator [Marinomonas ushuaiensis DSM 15871]